MAYRPTGPGWPGWWSAREATMKEGIRRTYAALESKFPDRMRERLQCLRRRPHWARQGIIFVHVPKAAGTSISNAIYGRPLGHIKAASIREFCPELFARSDVFSVVRNPWDRAVSAYEFARQGGTDLMGIAGHVGRASEEWRDFPDFLTSYLAGLDTGRADYVFQPQSAFVCDDAGLIVHDIFRLERMDEVEAWLRQRISPDLNIGSMNASQRPRDYRERYRGSQELIDIVGTVYAEDVRLFGYDF